jgi:hypothetical protein
MLFCVAVAQPTITAAGIPKVRFCLLFGVNHAVDGADSSSVIYRALACETMTVCRVLMGSQREIPDDLSTYRGEQVAGVRCVYLVLVGTCGSVELEQQITSMSILMVSFTTVRVKASSSHESAS